MVIAGAAERGFAMAQADDAKAAAETKARARLAGDRPSGCLRWFGARRHGIVSAASILARRARIAEHDATPLALRTGRTDTVIVKPRRTDTMADKQTLKLADDLFPGLKKRRKKATIRLGKRDILPGALTFEATNGSYADEEVEVIRVSYLFFAGLTDVDAAMDGCSTADELRAALKRFYPDAGP